jgi:hypothetical protein
MSHMERREFIALVGGGGLLLTVKVRRARGQQPAKILRGSSNANGLCGGNSAGPPQIYAIFERDSLCRHF